MSRVRNPPGGFFRRKDFSPPVYLSHKCDFDKLRWKKGGGAVKTQILCTHTGTTYPNFRVHVLITPTQQFAHPESDEERRKLHLGIPTLKCFGKTKECHVYTNKIDFTMIHEWFTRGAQHVSNISRVIHSMSQCATLIHSLCTQHCRVIHVVRNISRSNVRHLLYLGPTLTTLLIEWIILFGTRTQMRDYN